ncbi:MAG: hypothetical protein KTR31_19915 [Myxococcales bacterium]|nr:hypothetical protein [Myxococcales bacterium]
MEIWTRLAWAALALLHVPPAAVAVAPSLTERLYGADPHGEIGILVVHRGVLFAAVAVLAAWAVLDPGVRRSAAVMMALSVCGFLAVYARAGFPPGPLRTIALADTAALLPLAVVVVAAFR